MSARDHLRVLLCTSMDDGTRCVRRWLHEDGHLGRDNAGHWLTWVSPPPAVYEPHELQPGWEQRAIQEQEGRAA